MSSDIVLGGVELPNDIYWSDEFTSWKVAQNIKTSLTGARIVQEAALQSGRPITLESGQDDNDRWYAMLRLDTLRAVQALEEAVGASYTLTLPAHNSGTRSFTVMFRRDDGDAIEAKPVRVIVPAADTDLYAVTLRLMTV